MSLSADSVFDWGSDQEFVKKLAIDCRASQFQQWAESSSGSCSLTTVEDKAPPTEPKPSVAGRFESNKRLSSNHFKDLTDLVNEDSDSDEDLDFDIEMPPAKSSRSFTPKTFVTVKRPKPDPYSLHKLVLVFALMISVLVGGLVAIGFEISSTHPEEYAHELEGQSAKDSHRNGSPQKQNSNTLVESEVPIHKGEPNKVVEDGKRMPVHQSEGTNPRGNERSQPSDSGLEYLPSTSAEHDQAGEMSSAMPPLDAIDDLPGAPDSAYQQQLLKEAELVSKKCPADRLQCEQLCKDRMCCFEEDEQASCIEDADMACPAYAGCGSLLEDEVARFRAGQ